MIHIEKTLRGILVMAAALSITTTAHATTVTLGPVYPGTITGTVPYSTDEALIFKFTIAAPYSFSFTATGTGGNFPAGITETAAGTAGDFKETFGQFPFNGTVDYALTTSSVPEPATWAMILVGMGAIGFARRRRMKVGVSYA